jgi:hypothetical protein
MKKGAEAIIFKAFIVDALYRCILTKLPNYYKGYKMIRIFDNKNSQFFSKEDFSL